MCLSPKSNSGITAIDAALSDIRKGNAGQVPDHIKDGHYTGAKKLGRAIGYQYPHNSENGFIPQQYLPDKLKNRQYYHPNLPLKLNNNSNRSMIIFLNNKRVYKKGCIMKAET